MTTPESTNRLATILEKVRAIDDWDDHTRDTKPADPPVAPAKPQP